MGRPRQVPPVLADNAALGLDRLGVVREACEHTRAGLEGLAARRALIWRRLVAHAEIGIWLTRVRGALVGRRAKHANHQLRAHDSTPCAP